jgi:hypothetical protein
MIVHFPSYLQKEIPSLYEFRELNGPTDIGLHEYSALVVVDKAEG